MDMLSQKGLIIFISEQNKFLEKFHKNNSKNLDNFQISAFENIVSTNKEIIRSLSKGMPKLVN